MFPFPTVSSTFTRSNPSFEIVLIKWFHAVNRSRFLLFVGARGNDRNELGFHYLAVWSSKIGYAHPSAGKLSFLSLHLTAGQNG